MQNMYAFEIFNVVEMCIKSKEYQKDKKNYKFLIILWFPIAICFVEEFESL